MAHLGHPVLGDPLYGRQRQLAQHAPPELLAAIEALQGQALHAIRLSFTHPTTGETMEFQAPLPEDFRQVLDLLEEGGGVVPAHDR
jgi:23S rRNA pseudouridine1911/1915/1917 synthase